MSDPNGTPPTPIPPVQTHEIIVTPGPAPAETPPAGGGAFHPGLKPVPESWRSDRTGSWNAYQGILTQRNEFKTTTEAQAAEITTLREQVGRVAELEAELANVRTRAAQDIALHAAGGNFAKHASVQRLARREYDAYRSEAGEQAASFGDWLGSDAVKADPVFAPHFAQPAPAGEPVFREPTPPAPTGANGAQIPVAPQVDWGSASVTNRYKLQPGWRRGKVDIKTGAITGGSAGWQAMKKWETEHQRRSGTLRP